MITVSINGFSKDVKNVTSAWIVRCYGARNRVGLLPCVEVHIDTSLVKLILRTPGCGGAGGGGRSPNDHERDILHLWEMVGLNSPSFTPEQIDDFLKRLRHAKLE